MDENTCLDLKCSVHYRVDGEGKGIAGGIAHLSYVGNYFIITDEEVRRNMNPDDALKRSVEALILRMGGADDEAVGAILDEVLEGVTLVYYVGPDGTYSDVDLGIEPTDVFYGDRHDNVARHQTTIEMYRLNQGFKSI